MKIDKIRESVRAQTWRVVPQIATSQLHHLANAISETLAAPGTDPSERIALHAERSVYREEIQRRASPLPPMGTESGGR